MIDLNSKARQRDLASEEEFLAFARSHFDAAYYISTYGDVACAGIDALDHWLTYGCNEGRQISRSVVLRYAKDARRSSDRGWKRYRWRGLDIAIRLIEPIPREIVQQIVEQSRHDAALFNLDPDVVAGLAPLERENVLLDVSGLQAAIPEGAEFLLIQGSIEAEQRELIDDLIGALASASRQRILTIVTDQESTKASARAAGPFCPTDVVFWRDFWIEGPETVKLWQLAQLIRALRPRVTIVADSRHGYEIIARFGQALSECTKVFCIYSTEPQSREYAARFPGRTLPFATALTDDPTLAAKLDGQYGDLLGHRVMLLPQDCLSGCAEAVAKLFS